MGIKSHSVIDFPSGRSQVIVIENDGKGKPLSFMAYLESYASEYGMDSNFNATGYGDTEEKAKANLIDIIAVAVSKLS